MSYSLARHSRPTPADMKTNLRVTQTNSRNNSLSAAGKRHGEPNVQPCPTNPTPILPNRHESKPRPNQTGGRLNRLPNKVEQDKPPCQYTMLTFAAGKKARGLLTTLRVYPTLCNPKGFVASPLFSFGFSSSSFFLSLHLPFTPSPLSLLFLFYNGLSAVVGFLEPYRHRLAVFSFVMSRSLPRNRLGVFINGRRPVYWPRVVSHSATGG